MREVGESSKSPVEEVKRKTTKMTAEQLTREDRRWIVKSETRVRTRLLPMTVAYIWC